MTRDAMTVHARRMTLLRPDDVEARVLGGAVRRRRDIRHAFRSVQYSHAERRGIAQSRNEANSASLHLST